MSSSNQSNEIDYKAFGFEPEVSNNKTSPIDYKKFGFQPEKNKAGKAESIVYGAAEGLLGIPALVQYGINEFSKSLESQPTDLSYEDENSILSYLQTFPESEDQTSRRLRIGTSGAIGGLPFGPIGVFAGVVGSQVGQTIRETFGNEGKFDTFGLGEASAIGTDILAGGGAAIGASLARNAPRVAAQTARTPAIFQRGENLLQRATAKSSIQGDTQSLLNTINSFGDLQLRGFENEMSRVSPNKYTELTRSNASGLRRHAENTFRNSQLNNISPISTTNEQGAKAIQEAANQTFQNKVITAEREAYQQARLAAEGLTGKAPRTIQEATSLRNDLIKNNPTPEQQPLVNFLNGLIQDLETRTPESITPTSTLLDLHGNPLVPEVRTPATVSPTIRSANDLVDLVQRANQAVNYDSELRTQSHRLMPLLGTLRKETGQVLSKRPHAFNLYQGANNLHAQNAEIWGTRYMRNLRFAENPETIIGKTKLASNMRNLKSGITDPNIQSLAERLVINQITEGGTSKSNATAIRNLNPELSLNARNASQELINVKDPLTTTGGRAAVRNDILKDAAQSVSTGKRPEKILNLMQTQKGYEIVRESLNAPEARRLFSSFQRLFLEDIFSSITDKTGRIDFTKAKNIIKNNEVRNVIRQIGGDGLIRRFNELESFANNFERNINLYKSPETISLFKKLVKGTTNATLIGGIMHALHVPLPIIVGLGLSKAVATSAKVAFNSIKDKILSNPKALRILEEISLADTTNKLSQQLPRLVAEIDKKNKGD